MLSRVADSLYWMSRYLERAEHAARLLDENLEGSLEANRDLFNDRWNRLCCCLKMKRPAGGCDIDGFTRALAFDVNSASSIVYCVNSARENLRQVRQQISSEMWEQLNLLFLEVRAEAQGNLWKSPPNNFLHSVKQGVHLFHGITDSTLSHGEGWQFIQLGKYLERAGNMANLLDTHFKDYFIGDQKVIAVTDYLQWVGLLKSATGFEAYCKVYTAKIRPEQIAEFLLLDPQFPRSISFCASMIKCSVDEIAECADTCKGVKANRLAGRLKASLNFSQIDEIISSGMDTALNDVKQQCSLIHDAVQQVYINSPIEAALEA